MFYQSSKTARAAAIGTIMPWTGGIGNVPNGWIVCEGSVLAVEYPLLAQAIGDTYNGGVSTFAGTFPAYTGQIKLPDLNDKALMDIEQSYFGASAPRAIDRDSTATSIISNFVGPESDNIGRGISNVFNDKYTDIIFDIPGGDRGGYGGKIRGNTIIPGEAEKIIYIAPRKLSRNHLTAHKHPGSYPTIQLQPQTLPGKGVIPWSNVQVSAFYTANQFGSDTSKVFPGYSVTVTPETQSDTASASGWGLGQAGRTMAGIVRDAGQYNMIPRSVGKTPFSSLLADPTLTASQPQSYQRKLTGPDSGGQVTVPYGLFGSAVSVPAFTKNYYDIRYEIMSSSFSSAGSNTRVTIRVASVAGITVGQKGRIENHTSTPIINTDITVETIDTTNNTFTIILNFALGAFANGGATGKIVFDTGLFNTFTNVGQDDMTKTIAVSGGDPTVVVPHDHDEIEISFVQGTTKALSSINADVNLSSSLVLGNAENKGALQINFNTSQPSMSCLYIIRAY